MLKALTKTRSANFYANQVKVLLLILIGVLVWTNNDARNVIADGLDNVEEFVRPDNNQIRISFWCLSSFLPLQSSSVKQTFLLTKLSTKF